MFIIEDNKKNVKKMNQTKKKSLRRITQLYMLLNPIYIFKRGKGVIGKFISLRTQAF